MPHHPNDYLGAVIAGGEAVGGINLLRANGGAEVKPDDCCEWRPEPRVSSPGPSECIAMQIDAVMSNAMMPATPPTVSSAPKSSSIEPPE